MIQLSATRCSCIAILWVSLVSFAAKTLCVASQRVFIVAVVYFVINSVRKPLDTPSHKPVLHVKYFTFNYKYSSTSRNAEVTFSKMASYRRMNLNNSFAMPHRNKKQNLWNMSILKSLETLNQIRLLARAVRTAKSLVVHIRDCRWWTSGWAMIWTDRSTLHYRFF